MKISARNILKGKVKEVKHGMVDTEVDIELPGGGEIVSSGLVCHDHHIGCLDNRINFLAFCQFHRFRGVFRND